MNRILEKLNDSKKIIELIQEYVDIIKPIIENQYKKELKLLEDMVISYPKMESNIFKNVKLLQTETPTAKITFQLYGNIQILYNNMENTCKILNKTFLNTENINESNVSQTYRLEASDYLHRLTIRYNAFVELHKETDEIIVDILYKLLWKLLTEKCSFINKYGTEIVESDHFSTETTSNTQPEPNKPINQMDSKPNIISKQIEHKKIVILHNESEELLLAIDELRDYFYQNFDTAILYQHIMQKLILIFYNVLNDENIYFSNILMNRIEQDKNIVLLADSKKSKFKKIHIANPSLSRFGLIPITDSIELSDALYKVFKKKFPNNIDLSQIAEEERINIIVSRKIVSVPIEYSINSLINRDIAKQYKQKENSGINKKTIERFNNIRLIGQPEAKTNNHQPAPIQTFDYDFGYDIYEYKCSKYCIFETLDGKTYRILTPWLDNTKYIIDYIHINGFIKYISEPNQPLRATAYQRDAIKQMSVNMFMPNHFDIESFTKKSSVNTQILQNSIFLDISEIFHDNIDEKVKTTADINRIIHIPDIKELLIVNIIRMYNNSAPTDYGQEAHAGQFPFAELLTTFFVSLDKLAGRFMKELHDGYNNDPLIPSEFTADRVKVKLDDVLLKTIHLLIDSTENIYSNINFKYLILNY